MVCLMHIERVRESKRREKRSEGSYVYHETNLAMGGIWWENGRINHASSAKKTSNTCEKEETRVTKRS